MKVAVHVCGVHGVQRGNYFRVEPARRTEVEVSVGKLKNGKATNKGEFTEEIIR